MALEGGGLAATNFGVQRQLVIAESRPPTSSGEGTLLLSTHHRTS